MAELLPANYQVVLSRRAIGLGLSARLYSGTIANSVGVSTEVVVGGDRPTRGRPSILYSTDGPGGDLFPRIGGPGGPPVHLGGPATPTSPS